MGGSRKKIWILDSTKKKLGYYHRKGLRIGNTFRLCNMNGFELYTIAEKSISMRSKYIFYKGGVKDDDGIVGILKQKVMSISPKYYFEDPDGNTEIYRLKKNFFKSKCKLQKKEKIVARANKKILKSIIKDTVVAKIDELMPDEEAMLILAIILWIFF